MRDAAGGQGAGPRVIAQRWDQLGGRLGAIVDAAALAELFELEFGFVWPRGLDVAINQPADIFAPAFLAGVELDAEWPVGRPLTPEHELLAGTEGDARSRLDADPGSVIEVNSLYAIARGSWEDADAARARFIRCWSALGWNRMSRS